MISAFFHLVFEGDPLCVGFFAMFCAVLAFIHLSFIKAILPNDEELVFLLLRYSIPGAAKVFIRRSLIGFPTMFVVNLFVFLYSLPFALFSKLARKVSAREHAYALKQYEAIRILHQTDMRHEEEQNEERAQKIAENITDKLRAFIERQRRESSDESNDHTDQS